MAAFTRSGARKASEIVMLTLRMLHRSRLAMLSAFACESVRSSSSQRRPRAIDATRSARDSRAYRTSVLRWKPRGQKNLAPPRWRCLAPPDIQDVVAVSPLTVGRLCSGKVDDQLLRPDLDARDVGLDEATVVNRRRRFEMLPNRPYDQHLDVGCRHPAD